MISCQVAERAQLFFSSKLFSCYLCLVFVYCICFALLLSFLVLKGDCKASLP